MGSPSQVAQWERTHLPMQEMQVPSLGWEDPAEEEMATHASILALKIPRTEEPGGLRSPASQELGTAEWLGTPPPRGAAVCEPAKDAQSTGS